MPFLCLKKKQDKKDEKGNEEKSFFLRKHSIGQGKFVFVRLLLAVGYLVWNIVSYAKQEQLVGSWELSDVPVLFGELTDYDPLFKVPYGPGTNLECRSCKNLEDYFYSNYEKVVYPIVTSLRHVYRNTSLKQLLILLEQILNFILAFVFSVIFGTNASQIYMSLSSILASGSMNGEEITYHMVKYAKRVPEIIRKGAFYFVIFYKIVFPFSYLISFLTVMDEYRSACTSNHHVSDDDMIELISRITAVLIETGLTQDYLFHQDLKYSVKHFNDSSASCSTDDYMKQTFSNVFTAISFIQMVIALFDDFKRIYTLTCGRKDHVSHFTREEINSEYLVAVPNAQPKKNIKFSSKGEKNLNYEQQMQKLQQQQQQGKYQQNNPAAINQTQHNGNQFANQQGQMQNNNFIPNHNQQMQQFQQQPYQQQQQMFQMQQQQMLQMQQPYGYNNNPQAIPLQYQYNNPNYQFGYQNQPHPNNIQYKIGNPSNVIY